MGQILELLIGTGFGTGKRGGEGHGPSGPFIRLQKTGLVCRLSPSPPKFMRGLEANLAVGERG
jgi:hypothetical protein